MRHAILGAGGVGGLLAGMLAHTGDAVTLIVREGSLGEMPRRVRVESATFGTLESDVEVATSMPPGTDVLWITTKATHLDGALRSAPADRLGNGLVIPLLNGIDHLEKLRTHYPPSQVVAGTIRVEAERVEPGLIRQPSPFAAIELAGDPAAGAAVAEVANHLRAAGFPCTVESDALAILWRKLVLLGPLALATTASASPLGYVRAHAEWRPRLIGCAGEACAVAQGEGVAIVADSIVRLLDAAPYEFRSSMQKDVEAGRAPELDAIGGALVRRGAAHRVPTPTTQELITLIEGRLRS